MTYLAISNTYDEVQIALCVDQTIVARTAINKIYASPRLIPEIDTLLTNHNFQLADLSFIVANVGPGPFTTLRAVLATVNGIQAASSIPLIGIDSLDALVQEYSDPAHPLTIALLNAFNQDVYYAIRDTRTNTYTQGCQNSSEFIDTLTNYCSNGSVQFLGNGALLHHDKIIKACGSHIAMPTPMPETCSVDQIAHMGLEAWNAGGHFDKPLAPHYLKSATPSYAKAPAGKPSL